MEGRRGDAGPQQAAELVGHEGDERGHDHGQAAQGGRRGLVAERLARPRRHHDEGVAAGEGRRDRAVLAGAQTAHAQPLERLRQAGPLRAAARVARGRPAGRDAGHQAAQERPLGRRQVRPRRAELGQPRLDDRVGRPVLGPDGLGRLDLADEVGQGGQGKLLARDRRDGRDLLGDGCAHPRSLAASPDAR